MMTLLVWWCLAMLRAERWVFFCYGIMVLHEFAHVMAAVILHCPVEKIVINVVDNFKENSYLSLWIVRRN